MYVSEVRAATEQARPHCFCLCERCMEKRAKFAEAFYGSGAWQSCRESYAKSKAWVCERCGKAGEQVHHKVRLTPANLNDPAVSLNWANLELLCDECHKAEHKKRKKKGARRYAVAEDGTLLIP